MTNNVWCKSFYFADKNAISGEAVSIDVDEVGGGRERGEATAGGVESRRREFVLLSTG